MTIDVNSISAQDFKTQFYRDFPYLPVYDNTALYNMGDEVYYPATRLFYTATQNGVTGFPPNANPAKWALTPDSTDNYVQDQDINNAFVEAQSLFNVGLFSKDATQRIAYLYLTAHFLCNDIKAMMAGGINATPDMPVTSRSVGSVSESYAIPEQYLKNPQFAFYTGSRYGLKYLQMALPSMIGNVVSVYGGTNP